ncbi:MAG: hypothetical protein ACKVU1_17420 [bacterium]
MTRIGSPLPGARSIFAIALVLVLTLAPSFIRAQDVDEDLPGARLGLSGLNANSGSLLGFIDRERLDHSRSLSLGYATTTGSVKSQSAAAAYTDFFSYQMRQNLRLALALQYQFETSSRTLRTDSGEFSVLPSFALEYNPTENSIVRLSYGRLGTASPWYSPAGFGSPFAVGTSRFTD